MFFKSLQRWILVKKGPMQEGCRKLQNCCGKIPFSFWTSFLWIIFTGDVRPRQKSRNFLSLIFHRLRPIRIIMSNLWRQKFAAKFNKTLPPFPPTHSHHHHTACIHVHVQRDIWSIFRWAQPSRWMNARWSTLQPRPWGPQPKPWEPQSKPLGP